MEDGSDPRTDIALSLALIVVCGIVLWETRDIPPGVFEPLGSAPVPQAVASLIVLLALVVMARAWLALRRGEVAGEVSEVQPRARDAALVLGLTVLYVLALQLRLLDFAWLTTAFLFVAIGLLVGFARRSLPLIAALALAVGFGCQHLFTRVFVVDLPGL